MCLVPTVLFMTDNFTFEDEDKSTIARLIDIDKVHESLSLYNQIVVSALGMYSIRIYPFYMSWLSFSFGILVYCMCNTINSLSVLCCVFVVSEFFFCWWLCFTALHDILQCLE